VDPDSGDLLLETGTWSRCVGLLSCPRRPMPPGCSAGGRVSWVRSLACVLHSRLPTVPRATFNSAMLA